MKSIVALALIFFSCVTSASLPSEAPDVAIVVTSCHEIVGVIMVMSDGRKLVFDKDSGEDVEEVKKLAQSSKKPVSVYEVGCYQTEPTHVRT